MMPYDPYTEFNPQVDPSLANSYQQPQFSWQSRLGAMGRNLLGDRDLALALLANSGQSPVKRGLGEILGQSMLQADQAKQERNQQAFNQAYQMAIMQKMQREAQPNTKPIAVIGPDGKPTYVSENDAIGRAPYQAEKGMGALYPYIDPVTGKPTYGDAAKAIGNRPYDRPPQPTIPTGYRPDNKGGLEPIPGGPQDPNTGKGKITDNERLSAAYATRMRKAADTITALDYVPTTSDMVLFNQMLSGPGMLQSFANKSLSPKAQQYLQAVQDFNRAKLRKESGAAIGKEEVFGDLSTFFPVPGDDPTTLAQKAAARETAINGMIGASGAAYKAPEKTDTQSTQTQESPVQVKSDQEYNNLPSGALYIAPDGSTRRKK